MKKTQKMTNEMKDKICKNFIKKHNVGSNVHGIEIFDIAKSSEGVIYVIVPLHEFAQLMDNINTDKE